MGKIAALYDVRGIQEFIFSSPKLKENIGASVIVKEILNSFLMESIQKECANAATDWEKYSGLKIKEQKLDAELVYSGGGNALVIYGEESLFKKVNRALSKRILEETGGGINFAAAWVNTDLSDGNFSKERKELNRKIRENKARMINTSPLNGIAITRQGVTDDLPAQVVISREVNGKTVNEYISFPAQQKRVFEKENSFEKEQRYTNDYAYPREFDDLGQKEGENHIAVVHIDGNNMSRKLKELKNYEQLKDFSLRVNEAYKSSMAAVIELLIRSFKDETFFKRLNLKQDDKNKGKFFLPLRVVVLNGDDVTFVTDGRLGIPLAEEFLHRINDQRIEVAGKPIPISACAGIAIVKSHFPFYRAYQLADELCSSAKLKGKILVKISGEEKDTGNWLDYHIVYSGVTTHLAPLRQRLYNVPAMKKAEDLTFPVGVKEPDMAQECYHLLWRPWCVAGDFASKYCWNNFKRQVLLEFIRKTGEWPRSRLKKLRNLSIKSKPDIEILLLEFKSRGFELPEFEDSKEYFRENEKRTPYFDALELLDFYIDLPGQEEEK